MSKPRKKLGEILIERGVIVAKMLRNALGWQVMHPNQRKIGDILISMGHTSKSAVDAALLMQEGEYVYSKPSPGDMDVAPLMVQTPDASADAEHPVRPLNNKSIWDVNIWPSFSVYIEETDKSWHGPLMSGNTDGFTVKRYEGESDEELIERAADDFKTVLRRMREAALAGKDEEAEINLSVADENSETAEEARKRIRRESGIIDLE